MVKASSLWQGGPKYVNGGRAFPLTADSILLADFAPPELLLRVLDIGCGSGIIGLLIAWNNKDAHVTGIDISEPAIMCAHDNISLNSLGSRFDAVCGDIMNTALPERSFDLVVCNPPYFEKGRGKPTGPAREESTATLSDIVSRSSALLCPGGSLCIVIRADRCGSATEIMTHFGFSPKRLRLVAHTETSAPSMALIEARLGGRFTLEVLPQLILTDDHGCDSDEIKRIYRMN